MWPEGAAIPRGVARCVAGRPPRWGAARSSLHYLLPGSALMNLSSTARSQKGQALVPGARTNCNAQRWRACRTATKPGKRATAAPHGWFTCSAQNPTRNVSAMPHCCNGSSRQPARARSAHVAVGGARTRRQCSTSGGCINNAAIGPQLLIARAVHNAHTWIVIRKGVNTNHPPQPLTSPRRASPALLQSARSSKAGPTRCCLLPAAVHAMNCQLAELARCHACMK